MIGKSKLYTVLSTAVAVCVGGSAMAQEVEEKTPFYQAKESSKKATSFTGSITSSTFYFSESGDQEAPVDPALVAPQSASPTKRVFTDLRLRLKADHIKGGKFDFKGDLRFRKRFKICAERITGNGGPGSMLLDTCVQSQSGIYGDDERDVRELHVRYRASGYNLVVGRQFVPEVATIKFDGLRYEKIKNAKTSYVGFAGLYPTRGARDYRNDYPKLPVDPIDPMGDSERVLPVVAGAGVRYRRDRLYGAAGVAGILPRRVDIATGFNEKNRILLSSNGYWQQSPKLDVYHLLIFDVAGAAGAGISNLSVGGNYRPTNALSVYGQVNRVNTETLNVHAQNRLDTVDGNPASVGAIQNNWYVSRVAQDSARLGVSSSFKENRFQLSGSAGLRRRPEITIKQNDGTPVIVPLAQAIDIELQVVDRKSFKGFRFQGTVHRSQGYSDENLDRSTSTGFRFQGSRDLSKGKGEIELNAHYLTSSDENTAAVCAGPLAADLPTCYGAAEATSYGLGALVFYRPKSKWFAMFNANVARQSLLTYDMNAVGIKQPPVLMLSGFLRLAYRL